MSICLVKQHEDKEDGGDRSSLGFGYSKHAKRKLHHVAVSLSNPGLSRWMGDMGTYHCVMQRRMVR